MYGFIYITTNRITGKMYIGQRSYSSKGWQNYLGSGKYLKRAIARHGVENFKREIVFEAASREELDAAEKRFIEQHNAVESPAFYNLVPGGHGCSMGFQGKKHSAETRARMREAAMGHPVAEHVRKAVSDARKRHVRSSVEIQNHLEATKRGDEHHASRSVEVDGVRYPTLTAANLATGLSRHRLRVLRATQSGS